MPQVLFVHDHRFIYGSDGNVYTSGSFPSSVWKRYLAVFNRVTVLARLGDNVYGSDDQGKYALSSIQGASFVFAESASNLRTLLGFNKETMTIVRDEVKKHDAVIARLSSELGLLAIGEAIAQEKPWAVELVDCPLDALLNFGGVKAKLYAPIISARVKHVMSNSSHSLYVTKDFLQKRYPCKTGAHVVACSNVEIPSLEKSVLEMRENKITKNTQKLVLGQIASLKGRFKGIQTVMKALKYLREEFPIVEYHIVGGGDQAPWLAEARRWGVEHLCFFDGVLPSGSAVYEWLDSIDVYVHPSYKEGLPRAVIEAMSRGCPVIASNVAGIPELLPNDLMISPGNAKELVEKICKLGHSSEFQISLARRNFYIASEYTTDKLSSRRELFWREFKKIVDCGLLQGKS